MVPTIGSAPRPLATTHLIVVQFTPFSNSLPVFVSQRWTLYRASTVTVCTLPGAGVTVKDSAALTGKRRVTTRKSVVGVAWFTKTCLVECKLIKLAGWTSERQRGWREGCTIRAAPEEELTRDNEQKKSNEPVRAATPSRSRPLHTALQRLQLKHKICLLRRS